jgi:predicted RNase H-like HicB family nuclease
MKYEYPAMINQDGDWWIGWVEEVTGVNAQEQTKEELMESLGEALREAIEFNREDARIAAHGDFTEEPLAL